MTGDSGTAYATGAGEDNDALLDVSRLDDSPTPPPVEQPPAAAPKPPPTAPKPPPAPSGAKGTVVQLGAYGSTAKAETAWKLLSGRFPEVAGLSKIIVPYSGGFRLRAAASSPAEAQAVCRAVVAGGENCFVAQ